jgi:hypothetical protein
MFKKTTIHLYKCTRVVPFMIVRLNSKARIH